MCSLRASEQGKNRIRQARNFRGWIIEDPRWLREASKILDGNTPWTEEGPFAYGVSLTTWKRFLGATEAIQTKTFQVFCQVLGLNWEEIYERDEECDRPSIDRFEIPREPQESICYKTILQPGSLLRIKAPQYMGKTRMLNRVLKRVRNNDYQIVEFNFQDELDSRDYENLEQFLYNFCVGINEQLELSDNLDEYWNTKKGSFNHKTTVYLKNIY